MFTSVANSLDHLAKPIEWSNLFVEPKPPVYVVTMYRYGNHERHSYVLGVWSNEKDAVKAGFVEETWRAGKYKAEITTWIVDANEYDNLPHDEDDTVSK